MKLTQPATVTLRKRYTLDYVGSDEVRMEHLLRYAADYLKAHPEIIVDSVDAGRNLAGHPVLALGCVDEEPH